MNLGPVGRFVAWALLAIVVLGGACVLMLPFGGHSKEGAKRFACLSNVKQLTVALNLYAEKFDGRYPSPSWWPHLKPLVKSEDLLTCPVMYTENRRFGYAMNLALVGKRAAAFKDPAKEILIFETAALGEGVVANLAAMVGERHKGGSNLGFADGHAKFRKAVPLEAH